MKKLILAAVLGLAMAGGAIAQTNPPAGSAAGDPGAADKTKSVSDPAVIQGFYSDSSMTKLKTAEEVKAGWARLNIQDQTAVKEQCKATDITENMKLLCAAVETM
ncbi:MAG TPA: hypothetical protein VIU14_10465 [Mesorhizobium sp.]